jgi:hypothetical protein
MPMTEGGNAGFIDFAIGDYSRPSIGVEFCLKTSWNLEEVVYDFLKLIDPGIHSQLRFRSMSLYARGG